MTLLRVRSTNFMVSLAYRRRALELVRWVYMVKTDALPLIANTFFSHVSTPLPLDRERAAVYWKRRRFGEHEGATLMKDAPL